MAYKRIRHILNQRPGSAVKVLELDKSTEHVVRAPQYLRVLVKASGDARTATRGKEEDTSPPAVAEDEVETQQQLTSSENTSDSHTDQSDGSVGEWQDMTHRGYFENQVAQRCALHAVNNFFGIQATTAEGVVHHWPTRSINGPFRVDEVALTISFESEEGLDKEMFTIPFEGGTMERRQAILDDILQHVPRGKVIIEGEGEWPSGRAKHAAVLQLIRLDGEDGEEHGSMVLDSAIPSSRWGHGALLTGDRVPQGLPMVESVHYWAEQEHPRHKEWSIMEETNPHPPGGGFKRKNGQSVTTTNPETGDTMSYKYYPSPQRETKKTKSERKRINDENRRHAYTALGLPVSDNVSQTRTAVDRGKRLRSPTKKRSTQRREEVDYQARGILHPDAARDNPMGEEVKDDLAQLYVGRMIFKTFKVGNTRKEYQGRITGFTQDEEAGTFFHIEYEDEEEDMFLEQILLYLEESAEDRSPLIGHTVVSDGARKRVVRLLPPPTTGQESQEDNSQRLRTNLDRMNRAEGELDMPLSATIQDASYFPKHTTEITHHKRSTERRKRRPARRETPPAEDTGHEDEREWEWGKILEHEYGHDGCYYQVTDLSRLAGSPTEHIFSLAEIESFTQHSTHPQQATAVTEVGENQYKVQWEPFWVHSKQLDQEKKDNYWAKQREIVNPTRHRTVPSVPCAYTVDLETVNPDLDAEAPGQNIRKEGTHYIIYNSEGKAKGTVHTSRMHRLLTQAKTVKAGITRKEFISHMVRLMERYSAARKAAINPALKADYKNEWALKHNLTTPIIKLMKIQHELFSHPLNDSPETPFSWAPDGEDTHFGAYHNAYSWNWHDICIGNPQYSPEEIKKFVKYAIQAAKSAPKDHPVATVAFLPLFRDHDYMRMLNGPACGRLWSILRKQNFNFRPPDYWTGTSKKPKEADFGIGLYVIGNEKGYRLLRDRCTDRTKPGWAITTEPAWNKLHSLMDEQRMKENWNETGIEYEHAAVPTVGQPWLNMRSYANKDFIPREKSQEEEDILPGRQLAALWGFDKEKLPLKFREDESISTDGGKSDSTDAGGGITTPFGDFKINFEGIQTAHRAELLSLRQAVRLIAKRAREGHDQTWYVFTDSLVSLHTLRKYMREPSWLDGNPSKAAVEEIAKTIYELNLDIHFHKVKSHTGISGNERADDLATEACKKEGEITTVENLPNTIDGVLMERVSLDDDQEWKSEQLPFRKHYATHFSTTPMYAANTPTHWRETVTKQETPFGVKPLTKAMINNWSDAHMKTWHQACHNEFMTQQRAAAYTATKPYKRAANRASEPQSRRQLRNRMNGMPRLPMECPLCGTSIDSIEHTLLWCSHKIMKKQRIKRHNRILRRILEAIRRGRRGAWYLAGDLPGWGRDEQKRKDLETSRKPTLSKEEEPESLHVDLNQTPFHIEGLDTSDDDDTDEEYIPNPEELTNSEGESEAELTANTDKNPPKLAEEPDSESSEEENPDADPSRAIMPRWFEQKGSRRPDGVSIADLEETKHTGRPAGTPKHIDFFDVTVTSEKSVRQAIRRKRRQYVDLIAQAEALGYTATLHVLPIGVRGFIPHYTSAGLQELGIRSTDRKTLETAISRITRQACVGLLWTRRRTEMALPNREMISGFYRYELYRRLRWKYRKKYNTATT
jgi:ribonuclease HI